MCLNTLNLFRHRDVWSTTESSKHNHQMPSAVPLGVHLRPSSCLHRGAQIRKGKGILCHPHGPHMNVPQTLGFFTWHWIPVFGQLDRATKVLDFTPLTVWKGFSLCPFQQSLQDTQTSTRAATGAQAPETAHRYPDLAYLPALGWSSLTVVTLHHSISKTAVFGI